MIAPLCPAPGSEPDAFTRLIGEAYLALEKRREQGAQDPSTWSRGLVS